MTAKVRRVLTGELVGSWDGMMMAPEDGEQTSLTLKDGGSIIMAGTEQFGFLKDTMIYKSPSKWVRLSDYPRGRIELFKDGQWGTLCSHSW